MSKLVDILIIKTIIQLKLRKLNKLILIKFTLISLFLLIFITTGHSNERQ